MDIVTSSEYDALEWTKRTEQLDYIYSAARRKECTKGVLESMRRPLVVLLRLQAVRITAVIQNLGKVHINEPRLSDYIFLQYMNDRKPDIEGAKSGMLSFTPGPGSFTSSQLQRLDCSSLSNT
jgi:hypothetical protein